MRKKMSPENRDKKKTERGWNYVWKQYRKRLYNRKEYPDNDIIHIVDSDPSYYGHVNTFTNEFMDHIRKMDTNLYSAISYSGWVKMRLLSEYGKNYFMISSYTFLKELPYDSIFTIWIWLIRR